MYGRHLGINPVFEPDLLWIAEQALGAPLPPNWVEHATPGGDVYFANSLTGVTSWDHPLEAGRGPYLALVQLILSTLA